MGLFLYRASLLLWVHAQQLHGIQIYMVYLNTPLQEVRPLFLFFKPFLAGGVWVLMSGSGPIMHQEIKTFYLNSRVFCVTLWAYEEVTLGRGVGTGSAHRKACFEEIDIPQTPSTFASWIFFGIFWNSSLGAGLSVVSNQVLCWGLFSFFNRFFVDFTSCIPNLIYLPVPLYLPSALATSSTKEKR